MNGELYKISGLCFGWKDAKVRIFDDASFEIKRSALTVLIGKNGSGKTTLLRMMLNLIRPDSGSIMLDGKDIHTMNSRQTAKLVSYVPQSVNENIPINARDIVDLGNTVNRSIFEGGKKEFADRVELSLKLTDTLELEKRIFSSLSGGEKQKVMIARAICQSAPVMILDEPVSSLDIKNKIEIMKLLKDLSKNGMTVIAAVHDLNLASRFADEIIAINGKKVISRKKDKMLSSAALNDIFCSKIKIIKKGANRIIYY